MPIELNEEKARNRIARRIAKEFHDGDVVNLGIGIPTLVSDYIPEDIRVIFQTENGAIGAGPAPKEVDLRFIGAGGRPLTVLPGGSFVASDFSFGLIRGGHVDATVLGALEVSQDGDLANWMVPGKIIPGMGGAMDLVVGARRVIIAMTQTTKKGEPKIVRKCTLPLTAKGVVKLIVTEFAVFSIEKRQMKLLEIAPEVTLDDIKAMTNADFLVAEPLITMQGTEEEKA